MNEEGIKVSVRPILVLTSYEVNIGKLHKLQGEILNSISRHMKEHKKT